VICDGSVKNQVAAAAWIITYPDRSVRHAIEGACTPTGEPANQDLHRAECFGLLGGLCQLHKYLITWKIHVGTVTFACDNIQALRHCLDVASYPHIYTKLNNFDVLRSFRKSLWPGIKYEWKHVKGHQERLGFDLDFWALMNIRVDNNAKRLRVKNSQRINSPSSSDVIPYELWRLDLGSKMICNDAAQQIIEFISASSMRNYLHHKDRITMEAFDQVDWYAMGIAMKSSTPSRRRWIVKYSTGFCGVNYELHKRREKASSNCPRCGITETTSHVWKCKQPEAQ
jgi:hypothetical protein